MTNIPNRKEFAEVAADAYFSQYGSDDRRNPVMGNPVIDYDLDANTFGWCSSLTPTNDNEIRICELSEGCYGNWDAEDESNTEEMLVEWLTDCDCNEIWYDIIDAIETVDE